MPTPYRIHVSGTRTTSSNADAVEFQRIRIEVLGLTQIECSRLFIGGGHNAVSRYETGKTKIPHPAMLLMRLLEKHPELLDEIRRFPIAH